MQSLTSCPGSCPTVECLHINLFVALTKEKERGRNGERMFTSFLLQFLGESRGILQADPKRS
jgi:hypothetical protein